MRNSGWRLSGPGAFPGLSKLMGECSSSAVKSPHKPWSTDGEFHSALSSRLDWSSKLLIWLLEFSVLDEAWCNSIWGFGDVFFSPVSLLMVNQAFLLECFMSISSNVDIHFDLWWWLIWSKRLFAVSCFASRLLDFACLFPSFSNFSSQPGMYRERKPLGIHFFATPISFLWNAA